MNQDEFRKEYDELKLKYRQSMSQAIYETDPEKHAELVKLVLAANTELAQHVREFLTHARQQFPPELISKLTSEIIQFQMEYEALKKTKNTQESLKNILNKQQDDLNSIRNQFDMYLGFLFILIILLIILMFRSSISQLIQPITTPASSTSMSGSGSKLGSRRFSLK